MDAFNSATSYNLENANVPFFEGIRIHAGNTAKGISGCILVGYNTSEGRLTESGDTFVEMYDRLSKAKDQIEITISDWAKRSTG